MNVADAPALEKPIAKCFFANMDSSFQDCLLGDLHRVLHCIKAEVNCGFLTTLDCQKYSKRTQQHTKAIARRLKQYIRDDVIQNAVHVMTSNMPKAASVSPKRTDAKQKNVWTEIS